ncbi:MAG: SDR family NAD(P)-dependent oxidoreductase [Candidatus Aminicenantes bacterium]|nr:SDR family NAD(P)-dependent oxidoreductase [Candidatus Aminicenantes bacterium]
MKTQGNTVLITGGATGIGFALAESFVNAGNTVIIVGEGKINSKRLRKKLPQIYLRACDLSKEAVDTELGRGMAEEGEPEYRGLPPGKVAQAALLAMADNEYEIFVGEAKDLAMRARTNPERAFQNINRW